MNVTNDPGSGLKTTFPLKTKQTAAEGNGNRGHQETNSKFTSIRTGPAGT